jgi:glycosyltransferase involved in cell wall biosynthesis
MNFVKSKKIKEIVFLTRLFRPHIGGVEKHVEVLSQYLSTKGYKITIITENYNILLPSQEFYKGINIYRISYPKIKIVGLLMLWIKLLKFYPMLLRAHVIHVHDVFIWLFPFKLIFPNRKIYLTIHGWEGTYPIPYRNILIKRLSTFLSKKVIIIGDYISSVYGIKYDDISFGFVDTVANKCKKIKKQIVFLGRLEDDTGLQILLDVAPSLLDNEYSIIFCGDGSYRSECEKYGRVLGFSNPKRFLLNSEYCFASGYLSILEAFSYRCKVIVGYSNPLKERCYKDTPFSKWLLIVSREMIESKNIISLIKNKDWNVKDSFFWTSRQTIDQLSKKYLLLWQA